jgi:two-component sensor histidine kinase
VLFSGFTNVEGACRTGVQVHKPTTSSILLTTVAGLLRPHPTLVQGERRAAEHKLQQLLRQKELLVEEMQHRIANSLQIIASILLLKASTVNSEETRMHLKDAHTRVMSVAAVQQHLRASGRHEPIAVASYLSQLCATLAQSMISDSNPVSLEVVAEEGNLSSSDAVSVGLIVTEGVLNALKHAFPDGKGDSHIVVTYRTNRPGWTLSISDNGLGKSIEAASGAKSGLGTSILNALAQQLDAQVDVASSSTGTTVSVIHAASPAQLPHAA